jgi:hypothetical protein
MVKVQNLSASKVASRHPAVLVSGTREEANLCKVKADGETKLKSEKLLDIIALKLHR